MKTEVKTEVDKEKDELIKQLYVAYMAIGKFTAEVCFTKAVAGTSSFLNMKYNN